MTIHAIDPLLSCRGITKFFGAMPAVQSVSLDVHVGEVLGIGGPNGAGKTTLFDLISGVTPSDSGSVRFDGSDLSGRPSWEVCQKGLARTFQLNAGFDTLSVRENIEVAACFGYKPRLFPKFRIDSETRDRVDQAIQLVGLEKDAAVPLKNLPVLGRKLAMVAGALATAPKVVLLDEPVGGLNPIEIDRMKDIVEMMKARGITIILIEHVMRFLVQLSNRIAILHHGEIIYQGSAQGLLRDETVIDVYLGQGASDRMRRLVTEDA